MGALDDDANSSDNLFRDLEKPTRFGGGGG